MKRIFLYISIALCFLGCNHKDLLWTELVDDLDGRITYLEQICSEMNTNITSLQTIVDVLQSNDYITGIVEIKRDGVVIGYTITFGKHDPITIYHGQDGKDGQNGADGQDGQDGKDGQDGVNGTDGKDGADGSTPIIGVAQDTDGVYYWTLNGEWLLDDNGNKLPVSGKDGKDGANGADGKDGQNGTNGTDGKDGQDGTNGSNGKDGITPLLKIEDGYWYVSYDNGTTWTQFGKATGADGQNGTNGTDGKDGQDGADGKDGVTPQLKIEEGYWYISYDNGATWTQLGKATGEDGKDGTDGAEGKDGQDGTNGKDGQDGDSMFQSVTQDENYVYFTLADGTVIKIAKGTSTEEEQPNSEFMFIVTYDANGGEGVMQPDTFYYGVLKALTSTKFTKDSYYFVNWNTKADGTGISYSDEQQLMITKNITLYANWKEAIENGHEFVDLGLSVKWTTMNIGATSPEKIGNKYAWGEINTKSTYSWDNYKHCNQKYPSYSLTKYCYSSSYGTLDYKNVLETIDDAAAVNWGENWRMPSSSVLEELCNNCTWSNTTLNGTNVYKVTGPNGHSIYLPTTTYWLSNLGGGSPQYASCVSPSTSPTVTSAYRYLGYAIRPILP